MLGKSWQIPTWYRLQHYKPSSEVQPVLLPDIDCQMNTINEIGLYWFPCGDCPSNLAHVFMQCAPHCAPCIRCNFRRTLGATGLGRMPHRSKGASPKKLPTTLISTDLHISSTYLAYLLHISLLSSWCLSLNISVLGPWSTPLGTCIFIGCKKESFFHLLSPKIQYIPLLVVSTGQAAAKFTAGLTM